MFLVTFTLLLEDRTNLFVIFQHFIVVRGRQHLQENFK